MNRKNNGFTLIELMIVVAIIAIIAAIAVPNLLRSRMQTNEASAIQNLRTIVGSQVTYHGSNYVYTGSFDDLTTSSPAFLDGEWSGAKNGYNYTLAGDESNFTLLADPVAMGQTGSRGFYTDSSGVIRFAAGGVADETSPPLGEVAAGG